MNTRELEQAVIELRATCDARGARIEELQAQLQKLTNDVRQIATEGSLTKVNVHRRIDEMQARVDGTKLVVRDMAWADGIDTRLDALTEKVEGRNRSAAVKRNMTDADALRVLKGDVHGLGHKEAAEAIGLTYAQVYSCRLGFTFKHVHRDLEKAGWKSKWAKG